MNKIIQIEWKSRKSFIIHTFHAILNHESKFSLKFHRISVLKFVTCILSCDFTGCLNATKLSRSYLEAFGEAFGLDERQVVHCE